MIDRIRALDLDREHRALTEHVSVISPIALELLAYEKLTSIGHEARYVAGIQLRVVHELAAKLRWVERLTTSPRVDPGVRIALSGLLRNLCRESELLPVIDSEATVLLESATLFHSLLSRLRPWLPPMVLAFEPDLVVEMLQLGIPDYLHPLLRQRFEDLWELFHELRQQPSTGLSVAPTQQPSTPPAPPWTTPRWVSPWLDCGDAFPGAASNTKRDKLTG
ncbi:hypothetical protein [Enhygromyxa salina]|uniref:hypothetical protein n=1 Tax=Enhygromyxa salina TaxID=215803 RepID=UPI001969AFA2|nr:hypothetical protein [Enhygromyxa salina]